MCDPLDIENHRALINYLVRNHRVQPGEVISCTTLHGGVSNRTVFVQRRQGPDWVLKQSLAKLRVELDWFGDAKRVHREALGLRWLEQLTPPGSIAPFVFEDFDQHFFAMEAIPQPHANWKSLLLAGQLQTRHVQQFAELLAAIHGNAWNRIAELAPLFTETLHFEMLRLEPYYECAAEFVPEAHAYLTALVAATRERRYTLVHGDYSPKNVLVYDDRLIILDHEVIHYGDPAFDVGFALTHLLSKAHHLPEQRDAFREAAVNFWKHYRSELPDAEWAEQLEPHAVRHTLGCLLARVAGRSPLEYLDPGERARQKAAVLVLINKPPKRVTRLADAFLGAIDCVGVQPEARARDELR